MSVDVDFASLRDAVAGMESTVAEGLQFHGATSQREWLARMGIMPRYEALRAAAEPVREQELLDKGLIRLMDPEAGMGKAFKVAALTPADMGVPAGF